MSTELKEMESTNGKRIRAIRLCASHKNGLQTENDRLRIQILIGTTSAMFDRVTWKELADAVQAGFDEMPFPRRNINAG